MLLKFSSGPGAFFQVPIFPNHGAVLCPSCIACYFPDLYFSMQKALEGQRFDGIAWGLQEWIEELICDWVKQNIKKYISCNRTDFKKRKSNITMRGTIETQNYVTNE